jgi:D-alanyl-D-alanine carboxypeptidase/D-alanyl-D-alanine-endopeptidase (penicillin-binding protein 4)
MRHSRCERGAALFLVAFALLVAGPRARAAETSLSSVIDSRLAKPAFRGARLGVLVESLKSGEVLYERNADSLFIPASNMKIVTGAAALSLLGPDFEFRTVLASNGRRAGPVLDGDLVVRGSGDPSIAAEELWRLAEEVRALGIDTIKGDIVLDVSYLDSLSVASPELAEGDRAYEARTGALSLNYNTVGVHVCPGPRAGDPAVVTLSPDTGFVEARNRAQTVPRREKPEIEVRRTYTDGRNVITVSGEIPVGWPEIVTNRNVDDPTAYFGAGLIRLLANAGINVEGHVRVAAMPEDAVVLAAHDSKPLALIVRDLCKFSNNFIAEELLKVLSARELGPPGTTAGGAVVLGTFLSTAGADSLSYRIADGSGLSRENRLSPRTIVRVIRAMLSDFDTSYEFASSLSVSGSDGTLEGRMRGGDLERTVRAKTGLLDGVTAISGVARTQAGGDLLFSIIVNGCTCSATESHALEYAILRSMIGGGLGE